MPRVFCTELQNAFTAEQRTVVNGREKLKLEKIK